MDSFFGLSTIKKKFFKFDNAADLHFMLMNIVMLMKNQYPSSTTYYCYCGRRRPCCPPLKWFRFVKGQMCKLEEFCSYKRAIDRMCVAEFLDRNTENFSQLRPLADLIYPFFKKIFFQDKYCLCFFNDEYHWTHQDWNDSNCYADLSLREIIDYDKYLIKLKGPEKYHNVTYGRFRHLGDWPYFNDDIFYFRSIICIFF